MVTEIAEGTAAAAVDTAAPAASPLALEQPETEQPTAPETVPAEAPPETAVATPSPVSLDGLSDDDLASHERVKSLVARERESERRRTETRERQTQAEARRSWQANNGHIAEFQSAVSVGDDGQVHFDLQKMADTTGKLWAGSIQETTTVASSVIASEIPDDYTFTKEQVDRLDQAKQAYWADPLKADQFIREAVKVSNEAAVKAAEAGIRKDERKKAEADFLARQKTAEAKAAEDAGSPSPTRVSGAIAGRTWQSQYEIDTAHANKELTTAQAKALRADGTYRSLPYQ